MEKLAGEAEDEARKEAPVCGWGFTRESRRDDPGWLIRKGATQGAPPREAKRGKGFTQGGQGRPQGGPGLNVPDSRPHNPIPHTLAPSPAAARPILSYPFISFH
eukprot:194847-Chlamydomonas_euryale.AAC.1